MHDYIEFMLIYVSNSILILHVMQENERTNKYNFYVKLYL